MATILKSNFNFLETLKKNYYFCPPKTTLMSLEIKLFGGSASRYLADAIAKHYDLPLVKSSINKFSDGEIQPEIHESVRGAYVFFIQS